MAAPMRAAFASRNIGSKLMSLRQEGVVFSNRSTRGSLKFNNQARNASSTINRMVASKKGWIIGGVMTLTGVATSGGYLNYLYQKVKNNTRVFADGQEQAPKFEPSRKVLSPTDDTGLRLTLYQYQTCPFCCKVRAYLDFMGLSYDVIEVNSVWRTQLKWTKYKKVPAIVVEGQGENGFVHLRDSSMIISALETFLTDRTLPMEEILKYYPCIESQNEKGKVEYDFPNKYFVMFLEKNVESTAKQRNEERKWRHWVDTVLVHGISPNIYRTPKESLAAFRYFSEVGEWEKNFTSFEKRVVIYVGAAAMFMVGKMLKKRHSLKDDVRESLYEMTKEWTKAVGKDRKFMGGDKPNLADLAVYGSLSSFEGCEAFQDLLANTKIGPWFRQTSEAVKNHLGAHPLNKQS